MRKYAIVGLFAAVAVAVAVAVWAGARPPRPLDEPTIRKLCSQCHGFPPPDALPRFAWRDRIGDMYRMPGLASMTETASVPPPAAVADWYEARAPEHLALLPGSPVDEARAKRYLRHAFAPRGAPPIPGAANVRFLDVDGDPRLELVVCDARHGYVFLARPYAAGGDLQNIARIPFAAHAEVCDLDGDGLRDLVVAALGSLMPKDCEDGSVVWLRQRKPGKFEPIPLATGLGRVCDVQPFDADGDGDLDLAVAEFGWRASGRVLLLENRGGGEPGKAPRFEVQVLDERHGAIHVPVADLDGDGRPDLLALLAQEHEAVVAFLNRGGLEFATRPLDRAPHPAWGSSGLALADLDRDGDLDLLVTNGDTLDDHNLKPYHGLRWLERGAPGVTFTARPLAPMYGVHRAEAADLDGDGDLDIVACAFLPHHGRPDIRAPLAIPSLLLLEQAAPGRFEPHVLESLDADHATLAVADYDLDGDADIAVGNLTIGPPGTSPLSAWVEVWERR